MSVELLDGTTILGFIEDEMAFNTLIDARFASLDSDSDGKLTYAEMAKELMSLRVLGSYFGAMDEPSLSHDEAAQLYQGLFKQFDKDGDGMKVGSITRDKEYENLHIELIKAYIRD
ncbi:Calcium-binding EF-hand family protein [Rhynchospora pubera]|uniref:Calcium-binding EF-hand family protein n=1 Tax=Rhynchospora pubera TaxID=906938 RepID=A0AAV8G760_9POAL|nr:Calcium-binding EF-hand family protein [Rhynchospora pubera]